MNEFIEQFLVECRELLEQATDDLLALEENPDGHDRLDGAFRAFHTLKGAAGIVEFAAMARALHAGEELLAGARAGRAGVTPGLISSALTCLDQVVQWLDQIQQTGELPTEAEHQADMLVMRLSEGSGPAKPPVAASEPNWAEALLSRHPQAAEPAIAALRYRPDADCFFRGVDPLAEIEGLPGVVAVEIAPNLPWPALADMDPFLCQVSILALTTASSDELRLAAESAAGEFEWRTLRAQFPGSGLPPLAQALLEAQLQMLAEPGADDALGRRMSAVRVAANVLRPLNPGASAAIERLLPGASTEAVIAAIEGTLRGEAVAPTAELEAQASPAADPAMRAMRVDVGRIDALVRLAGELTVAKNGLGHAAAMAQSGEDPKALADMLKRQHALLDRLVSELQRSVLNIRVLPLRHVFQRFPRLVREMVVSLDKPVRLVTEGENTEADKAIVEALFEPLLHVIRNALDHGIEPGAERTAAGKPPSGTISLRARREGDQVVIDIEDDGRGVDAERVRAVARERGVASEEALAAMDDAEVVELIFAPGFSTASEVTSLSGRGVGMDAVRTSIARLGGRVSIASQPGQGALVQFRLPFSVVISHVMTVEAGGQVFGLPLDTVVETVKVPRAAISAVGAARAFVLRGRTIPLVDLAEVLGHAPAGAKGGDANVVVATSGGELGGLEVAKFGERLDVMLKPLDGLLAGAVAIAGATLMGDGRVLLVLDVAEVLQ